MHALHVHAPVHYHFIFNIFHSLLLSALKILHKPYLFNQWIISNRNKVCGVLVCGVFGASRRVVFVVAMERRSILIILNNFVYTKWKCITKRKTECWTDSGREWYEYVRLRWVLRRTQIENWKANNVTNVGRPETFWLETVIQMRSMITGGVAQ